MKKSVMSFLVVIFLLLVSSPLLASVVADYCFDSPNGSTAVDSSGNGNDGVLIGFTDFSSGYADDPTHAGYTSDGMIRLVKGAPLEYVQSGVNAHDFITNSFTIEAITSLHSDPNYWMPLVGYVNNSESTFIYWGTGSEHAKPHWHFDNGGPWGTISGYDDILTDGSMHHYAITYDADLGIMKMYLDYQEIATAAADLSNAVENNSGPLLIGSHEGISSYEVWNGRIDRIRFSNNVVATDDFIPNPVPIPGAAWLLGSGLLGLVAVRRRKKNS